MTSICRGKKLIRFCKKIRIAWEPDHFQRIQVFERTRIRFEGEVAVASPFDIETFSMLNIHHHMFCVRTRYFLGIGFLYLSHWHLVNISQIELQVREKIGKIGLKNHVCVLESMYRPYPRKI